MTIANIPVLLVAVFPPNVRSVFERSGLGSHRSGPWSLLIRGPLQVLLIGWFCWFAVREPGRARRAR